LSFNFEFPLASNKSFPYKNNMQDLKTIVELSHQFGTPEYVKGGGGNTSYKDDSTLWVKPSGTTLAGLKEDTFVTLNRAKVNELYDVETPAEPHAREELVKNFMAKAVLNDAGRPSVEAPLHNILETKFVVHTHALLVNGMTCSKDGEAISKRLFPDALWVEYIDAGYTLCMELHGRINQYKKEHGRIPKIIMLKNHGIFVSGDTAEEIRSLYASVMNPLREEYEKLSINEDLGITEGTRSNEVESKIQEIFGEDAAFVQSSGFFECVPGPITPDHLVYARAFPFSDELTQGNADAYRAKHGFAPKVLIHKDRIYGLGKTEKNAGLALLFAQDGAQVLKLSQAFGSVEYMTDQAREFIENWEVESYREKVAS
jgi:rhamnose utilization protein RhaD (predicted bifunctional aldolase and dehydrogenase)|tara:strand:- start:6158 stop:7273 length:1116 start_codon:yes stop_codon:yes gene_type:complete